MGFNLAERNSGSEAVPLRQTLAGRQAKQQWVKLVLGIGLVLASILGTGMLINTLNQTVKLYVAAELLLPGTVLRLSELNSVEVRLDQLQGQYLVVDHAGQSNADDAGLLAVGNPHYTVERTIGVGELIPLSALSTRSSSSTSLVLPLATELSAQLTIGHRIDIWAVGDTRDEFSLPPRILVSGAVLAHVPEPDSVLGSQSRTRVEVLLPQSSVAKVLAAINANESLSVVQANH